MKEATAGLFTYPILMAGDILMYQTDLVPVGKDQKQHVEIARDVAEKFNLAFGQTFKLPEPYIPEESAYILGTDGEHKMSKSYGNVIELFSDDATLKKQIMGIKTDSLAVEAPKDPEKSAIFHFYKFFASKKECAELAERFKKGGLGYGDAKKILLEKLMDYFAPYRKKRIELEKDLSYVYDVLKAGAKKARAKAQKTMEKVRAKTGLGT
jgi:tryptophanyl-tRNA synthetase